MCSGTPRRVRAGPRAWAGLRAVPSARAPGGLVFTPTQAATRPGRAQHCTPRLRARASEVAALPAWPGMAGRGRARSSRPAETWQGGGSELETERCHGKPPRSRGAGATSA